ncbi:hypothetical protein BDY24DRAFT_375464 [Mrakia frigida]|uniref:uncharacterized protein n=1 Tax=Mrakia frigida TaxID=29902 RepID=UPI003FCC1E1C
MFFLPLLFSSLLLAPSIASAEEATHQTVTIHHRVLPFSSSSSSTPPFTPRLKVRLVSPVSSEGLASSLPTSSLEILKDELGVIDVSRDEWYQIALQVEGEGESEWAFTTVKACQLLLPSSSRQDLLTLHFPSSSQTPFHLSYGLYNIPRDGSCPPTLSTIDSRLSATEGFNTTLRLKGSESTQSPILSAPPPLDPTTGRVAIPEVEKSLVQKYWMYAVIPMALFLFLPDQPEEGAAAAAK